jgi:hypothetical protein
MEIPASSGTRTAADCVRLPAAISPTCKMKQQLYERELKNMKRFCFLIAFFLVVMGAATALPPPLIASASAFNVTSRCVSRDVRTTLRSLLPQSASTCICIIPTFLHHRHRIFIFYSHTFLSQFSLSCLFGLHGHVTISGAECNLYRCCACERPAVL